MPWRFLHACQLSVPRPSLLPASKTCTSTDVTSDKNLGAMAEQTRAEFGRIDILVKNIYAWATPLRL